jgi:hypothetical protein
MHFQNQGEAAHPACLLGALLAVYLDPGGGSYYFQMMIAGLTTVFFFFTSIKQRIVSRFKTPPPPIDPLQAPVKESDPGKSKDTDVLESRRTG